MNIVRRTALVLYLLPIMLVLLVLDKIAGAGKFVYKIFHAAGCVLSRHIEAVMRKNGV